MGNFKRVHFIINPASGKPKPILSTINSALLDTDIDWTISVTTTQRDGSSLTKAAIEDGAELIAVYGGDGSVYSVVNGMAESEVPLALLHGGTGNALASEMGVPIDLENSIKLIISDHQIRTLDLGKVTGSAGNAEIAYFILRSNVGLQNRLLEEASREMKNQFGNLGYLIAGIRSLAEGQTETFHLKIDGEAIEAEGLTCIVANSAAIGGGVNTKFAPDIHPDDGVLDVFVMDSNFESLISMVNSSLDADLSKFPNHWHGKQIEIDMDESSSVTLDGESFCNTPVSIQIVPQAIHILTPKADMKENDA